MNKNIPKSYLPKLKKYVLIFLRRHYNEEKVMNIYHKMEELDLDYRTSEPYIGGKDNVMACNLYMSYVMFAVYEACDRKLTNDDLKEFINIFFDDILSRLPKNLNFEKFTKDGFFRKLVYKYLNRYAAKANANKGNKWANTWGLKINPYNLDQGLTMDLVGCPLKDFAQKHEMLDILPTMCNLDHKVAEVMGLKLYRDKTVSNGDEVCSCIYFGKDSFEAKQFANVINDKGLILSLKKTNTDFQ